MMPLSGSMALHTRESEAELDDLSDEEAHQRMTEERETLSSARF